MILFFKLENISVHTKYKTTLQTKYRGVGLIRTMEIAKKPYELAAPCKSRFFDEKMGFYPEFQIVSWNEELT